MKKINSILLLLLIALTLAQAQKRGTHDETEKEEEEQEQQDLVYIVMSHDNERGIMEDLQPQITVQNREDGDFHLFRMIPGLYGVGSTSFVSAQDPNLYLHLHYYRHYLEVKEFSDDPYFREYSSFYINHAEGYPQECYYIESTNSLLTIQSYMLSVSNEPDDNLVRLKQKTENPLFHYVFSLIDSQGNFVEPIKSESLNDGEGHFLGHFYITYKSKGIYIQGNQAILRYQLYSHKFNFVEGLDGSNTTSIQSASNPNQYLKIGEDFKLYLDDYQADDVFNRQASFRITYSGKGINFKYVRIQSEYNPDYYLYRIDEQTLSFQLHSTEDTFKHSTLFQLVRSI